MLRVHLFGRPRLLLDQIAFAVGGRPKVVPLLAYVLLHRDRTASRRSIAAALWPDEAEDEARANLRRHLNYLHAILPPEAPGLPWLLTGGGVVGWNPACELWLDVADFERLAATPHRLRDALALYTAPLLPDVDDEWLEPERERLASIYEATLSTLIADLHAARDYAPAIAAAQSLLAHDPWREDTMRMLMLLRYESGDRAGALSDYEQFTRTLHAELGADPMLETSALYQSILSDAVAAGTAERRAGETPTEGALGALPFVGRAAKLAALRAMWDRTVEGDGGLVLIGGEAGIGKSRLVRAFASACEARGALAYSAATTFPESSPYQPFVALLRAAVPLLKSVAVEPVWLSALTALVPAIAEVAPALPPLPAVEPARERMRLFEAYANVWEAIGARRPVVLIVEDVHWAGSTTLALLGQFARRESGGRVLLLATYREDELALAHPLHALRRRIEREGGGSHVALGRLLRADIEQLVDALGAFDDGPALARMLHERSDGNPFFLDEILRGLTESGALRVADAAWSFDAAAGAALPAAVRGAVLSRVERLDDRARALAEVAAVAGRGFDVGLLRETTGWPEASVLDALETLVDRRILAERGVHGGFDYVFGHQLIQAVVYDRIAPAIRTRRHHRIAHVMTALYPEQRDDLAAELALHWDRGGEPGAAAREYFVAAQRALAVYGNEEARRHLDRAIALTTSTRLRFDALLLHERVAAAQGDREAQIRDTAALRAIARDLGGDAVFTVLERELELSNIMSDRRRERVLLALFQRRVRRSGDPRWRARALEAEARYLRGVNDFEGSRRAFSALSALLEQTGQRSAHVKARLAVADSYVYEGRLDEARATLDALRAVVDMDGDQGALVRTLMAFARAALVQQDYVTMSRLAIEANDISRAIGDIEGEALALHTMANGSTVAFRTGEAAAAYARALALYERIRHRVGIASISVDFGLFHTEVGLLDRALEWFARAYDVAREIEFRFVICVAHIDISYCRRLRGDFEEAKAAAGSAVLLAREIGSVPLESASLGVLGAAQTALGEYDDAIAHLTVAVELRRPAGATPRLGDNLCALAQALLRAGDLPAARRAADEMLALYDLHPSLPPQPTEWLWTAAQVERARRRPTAADALLYRARAVMHERAAAIDDAATRAAFLALPFNRAVVRGEPVRR